MQYFDLFRYVLVLLIWNYLENEFLIVVIFNFEYKYYLRIQVEYNFLNKFEFYYYVVCGKYSSYD